MMSLTPEISTWRVLAVDDKLENLKLITVVLEHQGATVKTTTNAPQMMSILAEFQPNMILLDLAMPQISGWEIQQQLRSLPEYDDIPIIALTALAMQQDLARAKAAGFDGYTKPIRVDEMYRELANCVRAFLENRPNSGE
jgi:CheY-like chemotaxis protein